MTPPTQRHDARSVDERLELTAALANLLSLNNHRRVVCVAVGLGVAYAGYSALNHAQRTGFRLSVLGLARALGVDGGWLQPLYATQACVSWRKPTDFLLPVS